MAGLRYGTRATLAGTALADGGTAPLIAAPGAAKYWRLGALNISVSAAFVGKLQDGDAAELLTLRTAGVDTVALSLPDEGLRAPTANKALQVVNNSGATVTVGALALYRTEP